MSTGETSRRDRSHWPVLATLLLLSAAVGATVYWRWPAPPTVPAAAPLPMQPVVVPGRPEAAPAPAPVAEAPPSETRVGPSFDVVRVGPQGRVVIAGRAAAGAAVTVREGDRVIGTVRADGQGQFVLLPDAALPPGGRELTLSAQAADGKVVAGLDSVVVIVPPGPGGATPRAAVAVLLPQAGAGSKVLDAGEAKTRRLGLDTVDYDEAGEIRFTGSARPTSPVRVYVDNKKVGDAVSGSGGHWTLTPDEAVSPGVHQLRVDQLGPDGKVIGRVELPFQRVAVPSGVSAGRTIVQPGQNLWRIARQSYGQGTRYTVIYLANKEQIRDPNRIYPGQVFAVPPKS